MSPVDVLILAPLMPLAFIVVTWWLPWGKWIPWGELPKGILGPYVLYLSFAAWHFDLNKWLVLLPFIVGVVLSAMAMIEKVRKRVRHQASGA